MPQLINRGSYYELKEEFNWGEFLNSLGRGMASTIDAIQDKKVREQKETDLRLDLTTKINSLDPSLQQSLFEQSPELRRFLLDPKIVPKDQMRAMQSGQMEPLMPKVRKRTPLEEATLAEKQFGAGKEAQLERKATSEAELQEQVTAGRTKLMKAPSVSEQLLGLTGEIVTQDKLEAFLIGSSEQGMDAAYNKYMADAPGTPQFMKQMRDKALADLIGKVNPQTPEDMQGVQQAADWIAGLGPRPSKMPKTLERVKTDIDAMQARTAAQNSALAKARLTYDTNAQIHTLGDALSIRLKGTPQAGQAFSLAEQIIRGGKQVELPPDVSKLVTQEKQQMDLLTAKRSYEVALQESPKLSMLLQFAQRSASAGDDKGAAQYIKMAEVERKKLFGEDQQQNSNFWRYAIAGAGAMTGNVLGQQSTMFLSQLSPETAARVLQLANVTAKEVYTTATTTVPETLQRGLELGGELVTGYTETAKRYGKKDLAVPEQMPQQGRRYEVTPEVDKNIEDLARRIDTLSNQPMSSLQREQLINVLNILEEVKKGTRPFSDVVEAMQP